jgi:excisionase family DNA binding protein
MLNPQSDESIGSRIPTSATMSRASAARQAWTAVSTHSENAYSDSGNSPPEQERVSLRSTGARRRTDETPSLKHFACDRPQIVSLQGAPTGRRSCGMKAPRQFGVHPEARSLPELIEVFNHALTAKDLAKLLQVSVVTIYKLAKASKIPSFRIGTAVRFDPHAVARWLRQT